VSVVLLVWTDGQIRIPLAFRVWHKGGSSKYDLALELLCPAARPPPGVGTSGRRVAGGGRTRAGGTARKVALFFLYPIARKCPLLL